MVVILEMCTTNKKPIRQIINDPVPMGLTFVGVDEIAREWFSLNRKKFFVCLLNTFSLNAFSWWEICVFSVSLSLFLSPFLSHSQFIVGPGLGVLRETDPGAC